MRKININLKGYSNIIDGKLQNKIANRKHPMANMPYYPKNNEPTQYYEEVLIEKRFKSLSDTFATTFGCDKERIMPMSVMMSANQNAMMANRYESPHRETLIKLAEKIIREQYNLGEDEVLFDLELVNPGGCKFPEKMNKQKRVDKDFVQTTDIDALKKRTINAISQGSALKSHYIFHMYGDEINNINKKLSDCYQKALIANDLFYFILDDDQLADALQGGNDSSNAGYVKLNFDGKIPIIEAKAINFPILIHEITKGVITLLSVPGIQNMTQELVDEIDFIMAEIYEIRFGASIWEEFHSTIDVKDYDVKKLIIIEIFKKNSIDFHQFMFNVLNNTDVAKKEVKKIANKIKTSIMNYKFEKEAIGDDDEPVDFSNFTL